MRLISDNYGNFINADKIIGVRVAKLNKVFTLLVECEGNVKYYIYDEDGDGFDDVSVINLSNAISNWLTSNNVDNHNAFSISGVKFK